MKKTTLLAILCIAAAACTDKAPETDYVNTMRPSAIPLVTVDPYFSLWSFSDALNTDQTRHWTGKIQPINARVRVDGTVYRLMGDGVSSSGPVTVLPSAVQCGWEARYVIADTVCGDWTSPDFDDSLWNIGMGAFGSSTKGTLWDGIGSIWIRRTFHLDGPVSGLTLECSHDEEFELYINGVPAASSTGYTGYYEPFRIPEEAASALHQGDNVIACRCRNGYGAANIDFGIVSNGAVFDECTAVQTSCNVLPTRTLYGFTCGPVDFSLVFMTPLLMDNLDIMSRPVSYISYSAASNDGEEHDVQFMFTATPAIAVNNDPEPVVTETGSTLNAIDYVKCGTVAQRILARKGDDVRIDWGYLYLASEDGHTAFCPMDEALESFKSTGQVLPQESAARTEDFKKDCTVLTVTNDLGRIGATGHGNYLMMAYDDIYSVQYFWHNLRPWWNRSGNRTITAEIDDAAMQYDSLKEACRIFDNNLMSEAEAAGGTRYADLLATAYRQAIAAHKLVQSPDGDILFLSKENYSNGSIGTVDVTYPSSPLFLLYNPRLAEGLMNHIFSFSESGRWTKPFAAHDVGTYPIANGQTYPADMPVEESGNMLILTAAVTKAEGDPSYARKHWETLTTWAEYLSKFGLDPEEQLCTDDFAGHIAHNANLSVKAIIALASYAYMAGELDLQDVHDRYMSMARGMAAEWKKMAFDGDHYRLTFDRPGTWSQKYNMVWDLVLGFGLFDADIFKTETAYYLTQQNRYGLPLDSRKTYTKIDWILWTATMAGDRAAFDSLVAPVWDFENTTPDRLPMSDWVYTESPNPVGFRARSVVGGLFMPLLKEKFTIKD